MENSLGLYIVGAFLLVNLLLGLWAGKGVKDFRDYAVGNKRWSVGAIIMTYLATIIGGGSLFRESYGAYQHGFILFIAFSGISISTMFRGYLVAPRIGYFKGCISLGDVIGKLYGENEKIFTGIISLLYTTILAAVQIKALSLVFSVFLGMEGDLSVIISGVILTVYTASGGMKSVIATDVMQFVFLCGTFLILASYAVGEVGGLEELFESLDSKYIFNFENLEARKLQSYISVFITGLIFSYEIVQPPRMQRLLMCDSKPKLKRMFVFCGLGHAFANLMITLIALSAIIFLPTAKSGVDILAHLYNDVIPVQLKPFIVIGLISIIFSTGDSVIHSAGVSLTNDVLNVIRKKELSLFYTKILVILIGAIAILFAVKFNSIFGKLEYINSTIVPMLSIPVFLGMLGIKSTRKIFWYAAFSGLLTYIYIEFFSTNYGGLAILGSLMANAIVFLTLHYLRFRKFKTINKDNPTNLINEKIEEQPCNLLKIISKMVKMHGNPYVLFGIFQILLLNMPYLLKGNSFLEEQNAICLVIRTIGVILSALLITHSIWPKIVRPYLPTFWYLTLTYCLPFLSIIMLIMSHGSIEYTINVAINIMFLLLLVDWASAIGIGLVGTASAIGYYKLFIQIDPSETIFGFETKYLLIYQIIFGTIIGLLFARKKHIRIKSLDTNTDFLEELQQNIIETNNMSIAIADDANSTPENINLHPTENIKYLKNAFIDKNFMSSEISQKIAELEIFIASEEKNISPYMVLNADKVDLLKISEKFESFSKACACENTYLSIYSKAKTVKWDSSQVIKCIGKLAQNYNQKMKNFYDEDSDIFLNITVSDEKIRYISAADPTISREIDAIGIILSENENFYNTLKNRNFEKVMTDPEKIPSTRLKDHKMIDIERTIDAHYGVLQKAEDEQNLSYICVLPINVYDIRPITLDMDAPNVRDLSYNWPAAEELEAKFWQKIFSLNLVSQNKIKKAIDYIKIYHRHQTRKSGEPYYLHPMSVAMIAIDIAKQDSEIHDFLMENIETIILVALLHDILEDTYIKHKNILQNFGGEVLRYIESVTKTDFKQREFLLSNDQAFIKLINQEPITICVKIADRIHNLETIDGHPKIEKRKAVAEETMMFFTRAAKKYEMNELSNKLTSICNYIIEKGKLDGYF